MDAHGARIIAERIRADLAELTVETPRGTLRSTASIGLATYGKNRPDTARALLKRADEALYVAKRGGRDRIVLMVPEPLDEPTAGEQDLASLPRREKRAN